MVRAWTSVMVSRRIRLVMVSMRLGCTRPRVLSSRKVLGSASWVSACWASAAAICCHFALWWKPANEALARRAACSGVLSTVDDEPEAVRHVRSRREDRVVVVARLLASVAGHVRIAPNMVGEVAAEQQSAVKGRKRRVNAVGHERRRCSEGVEEAPLGVQTIGDEGVGVDDSARCTSCTRRRTFFEHVPRWCQKHALASPHLPDNIDSEH